MGFFRFRRSIKLLPGLRWNIGKRGSSLSFGGRGLRFTVGNRGSTTTVGIPGTGLSYTHTTPRQAQSQTPPPLPFSEEFVWASKQTEIFAFDLPKREPEEEPVTQEQITHISTLTNGVEGLDYNTLGTKQADAFIQALEAEHKRFADQKVQEYIQIQTNKYLGIIERRKRRRRLIVALILISVGLLWMASRM